MALLGRSTTFAQPMPGQPVATGMWDQVMTWGEKTKEGSDSVFDEFTLGQIVDNFRGRKNLIGMDYEHQTANSPANGAPAPQLALYNALAVIRNGKVIDFASRDELLQPPNPDGKSDGLYAYRCEVTPLGQQLLPNYRYISPMFDTDGADEQGNAIGYDLLNISAVSVPFQDGCEIQFTRLGNRPVRLSKGKKMDELKKFLGLADDVSMDDFFAECQKRFKKYDDDAAAMKKKFDDAMAKLSKYADGDADDDDKKKMDDIGMDDAAYDDAPVMADDDADASAMQKMAKALGFNGKTSPKKMFAALQAKTVPAGEVAKLRQDLEAMRAERENEKKAEQEKVYAKLADRAIDSGYDKSKRDSLISFARADLKAAEEFVASLPKASAMSRLTRNGDPIGKGRQPSEDFTVTVEDDISNDQASAEAHKYAKENGVDFARALAWVAQNKPQLYRRATR